MPSLIDKLTKFEADKQKAIDAINEKFKKDRDALASELQEEVKRAKSAYSEAQRAYDKFLGKTTRGSGISAGTSTAKLTPEMVIKCLEAAPGKTLSFADLQKASQKETGGQRLTREDNLKKVLKQAKDKVTQKDGMVTLA